MLALKSTRLANRERDSQGLIRLRQGTPDTYGEENDAADNVNGPFSVDLCHGIEDEDTEAEGKNQPRCSLRQGLNADSQLLADRDESWSKHRPIGPHDSCVHTHNEKDYILFPQGPVQRIVGIIRGLRHQQDIATRGML